MVAQMLHRSVYLLAGKEFDLDAATDMAAALTSQASTNELNWLADRFNLDHGPDADLDQRRRAAYTVLIRLLTIFADSLISPDVTSYQLGNVGNTLVDEYSTGGLASGDGPTDAYDAWDFLFDNETLPQRWGEYLATAGGLLHPNGDGPVMATIAVRAWGHLPA